jgi:hypothetical protein
MHTGRRSRYVPCSYAARPTWTPELLARVTAEHLGLHLSVGHLWNVLRQMGIRWNCARPVMACPWRAERRRRRLSELCRLERDPSPRGVVDLRTRSTSI